MTDGTNTQTTTLSGDVGLTYNLPVSYDTDFTFGQELSIFVGGTQNFTFTSDLFEIYLNFDFFPVWIDVMRNQIIFKMSDLSLCDALWWSYDILKVSLEV